MTNKELTTEKKRILVQSQVKYMAKINQPKTKIPMTGKYQSPDRSIDRCAMYTHAVRSFILTVTNDIPFKILVCEFSRLGSKTFCPEITTH